MSPSNCNRQGRRADCNAAEARLILGSRRRFPSHAHRLHPLRSARARRAAVRRAQSAHPTQPEPGCRASIISTSLSRPRRPAWSFRQRCVSAIPTRWRSSCNTSSGISPSRRTAFEVSLNFSRKPERLTVPFDSITGFSDPSVPVRLQARAAPAEAARSPATNRAPSTARRTEPPPPSTPVRPSPGKGAAERAETKAAAPAGKSPEPPPAAKVVSIDAFRKK